MRDFGGQGHVEGRVLHLPDRRLIIRPGGRRHPDGEKAADKPPSLRTRQVDMPGSVALQPDLSAIFARRDNALDKIVMAIKYRDHRLLLSVASREPCTQMRGAAMPSRITLQIAVFDIG